MSNTPNTSKKAPNKKKLADSSMRDRSSSVSRGIRNLFSSRKGGSHKGQQSDKVKSDMISFHSSPTKTVPHGPSTEPRQGVSQVKVTKGNKVMDSKDNLLTSMSPLKVEKKPTSTVPLASQPTITETTIVLATEDPRREIGVPVIEPGTCPNWPTTKKKLLLHPELPLEEQTYFHGILPREEINFFLNEQGNFLVRMTKRKDTLDFVLSVHWNEAPRHFILVESPDGLWRLENGSFHTIPELVSFYFTHNLSLTERTQTKLIRPVEKESWLLNNDDIHKDALIGKGNFGEVWKGSYRDPVNNTSQIVALKLCHESMSPLEKKKFVAEARIMRRYKHQNIVRLFGVAATKEPMMIVLELVNGGSLDAYLRANKDQLSPTVKLKYVIDCANGMEYLESKHCIHRDLAARNCLLDKQNNIVKISDFGLSREGSTYEMSNKSKPVPIKWTPIETLNNQIYTHKSDVWSFGILIWEIYADGLDPYPQLNNKDTYLFLKQGKRLGPPLGMQSSVNEVMQSCWEEDPERRPTFAEIRERLEKCK